MPFSPCIRPSRDLKGDSAHDGEGEEGEEEEGAATTKEADCGRTPAPDGTAADGEAEEASPLWGGEGSMSMAAVSNGANDGPTRPPAPPPPCRRTTPIIPTPAPSVAVAVAVVAPAATAAMVGCCIRRLRRAAAFAPPIGGGGRSGACGPTGGGGVKAKSWERGLVVSAEGERDAGAGACACGGQPVVVVVVGFGEGESSHPVVVGPPLAPTGLLLLLLEGRRGDGGAVGAAEAWASMMIEACSRAATAATRVDSCCSTC